MAAPAETSHIKLGKRTRAFKITQSGANDGNVVIEIPEPLSSMSIQVTGTFTDIGQSVELKAMNDGTVANRKPLPTAVAFVAATPFGTVIKSVAPADLGFRYYVLEVSGAIANSNLTITIVAKLV